MKNFGLVCIDPIYCSQCTRARDKARRCSVNGHGREIRKGVGLVPPRIGLSCPLTHTCDVISNPTLRVGKHDIEPKCNVKVSLKRNITYI